MLLHPDGNEEVLVQGGNGSVVDPTVSFDGQWVYYAKFHDLRPGELNEQRRDASRQGSDIFKINLKTRKTTQLTFQEWTPNTGVADWSTNHLDPSAPGKYYLGYGIFNLAPCPLPGGRVMFTSSRNGFLPNKEYTFPNLQLFVMDENGKNVEQIGYLNLGSALHPTILKDGRVMFSSYEAQGLRDQRIWGLWSIWPDGRKWGPLMSGFADASAFHFQTQLSNEHIAVVEYYNQNNNGFGTLLAFPPYPPPGVPWFGDPNPSDPSNPLVRRGIWYFDPSHPAHLQPRYKQYSFSPYGLYALTGFTHGEDEASSRALDGSWAGKVTHPSGAPNNDVLLVWSPGPANDLDRPTSIPTYDAGIYLIRGGVPLTDHRNLVLIKNSSSYNEIQPRAVVSYRQIHGVDEPALLPWLPNDGSQSTELPVGTPFGIIGTSSFYKRNSKPGFGNDRFAGLDSFNTSENGESSNWTTQGADAGLYRNDEIYAVRILAMEPTSHRSYGPAEGISFSNHANERLRILGEIPLRKVDAAGKVILDVDGNPDTSFLAKIPADVPFTFQTLDKDGLVLNMAQTWHQVRPGEVRNDCGGCHAHAQLGTQFSTTVAARPDYVIRDLANSTPLLSKDASGKPAIVTKDQRAFDVEYYRDIKPILLRSCVKCHSKSGPSEAGLVFDDQTIVDGFEDTYHRLANDSEAKYGIPPVILNRTWRQTNASRYIRMFQSRRSLLIWKVFGRRLDGWSNEDHPTEIVAGDPDTLPPGTNPNDADLDYKGPACPPPGSGVPALTEDEKMLFARWVDLGAPISSQDQDRQNSGWFADDLRPTLTLASPRPGVTSGPLNVIRFGAFDYYSGLNKSSLSVKASVVINGKPAGTELAPYFSESGNYVWTLNLNPTLTDLSDVVVTLKVRDNQGNLSTIERTFSIQGSGGSNPPGGGGAVPLLSSVSPDSGPTTGNTKIRILGENLKPEVTVRLGGIPLAQVTLLSDRELSAVTGPLSAGTYDLELADPEGTTAVLREAFTYRQLPKLDPQSGGGSAWRIPFVADTPEFRTNLGINNLGSQIATVGVSFVDNNGLRVAQKQITVPPNGMTQINHIARFLETVSEMTGREGYLFLESQQDIRAWASQIDNATNDPSLELARADAFPRVLLPSSASTEQFATSLVIINASSDNGRVNLRIRDISGELQSSLLNQPVPGYGYLFFDDLYRAVGLANSFGPVDIEALDGIRIMATARIFTPQRTSAYYEGIDVNLAAHQVVLPYVVDTQEFRSNIGINNLGTAPANVSISMMDQNGLRLGNLTTTVPPAGLKQLNHVIRLLLSRSNVTDREGYLRLESDQTLSLGHPRSTIFHKIPA